MEVNEDNLNENKKNYLFWAYYSKAVSHLHLCSGKDPKAGKHEKAS